MKSGERVPEAQTGRAETRRGTFANTRLAELQTREAQQNRDLQEARVSDPRRGCRRRAVHRADCIAAAGLGGTGGRDATYQQATAEIDKHIAELLGDPIIRGRVEHEFGQVRAGQVEQAKAAFQQATAQLAQEALATMAALVPEIQRMTPDQARGALALMAKQDPQRVAALQQLMGRSQNILAAHQQQVAQQQAQQQQRAEATFQQFAAEQDARC